MRFGDWFGHDLGRECSVEVLENRDVSKRDLQQAVTSSLIKLSPAVDRDGVSRDAIALGTRRLLHLTITGVTFTPVTVQWDGCS